jgi:hypothetical protein
MIFDNQTLFSDNQAITATARSTNVIDLQQIGIPYGNVERLSRDLGKSDDVPLLIQVTETFNNLTSLQVDIQTSDDPAFGSGVVTHSTTGAVLLASLVAGWRPNYTTLPEAGTAGMKRYLSLNYTVVGTAPTAGKIKSGIVAGVQTNGR